ncbi:iron-sulfur cluster assembly protein SufD [Klebsiella pneumoniae subsp. ozaenae]|uniref:Iron-sulfur cluster assembly protein SufD n=1 Tax=Klebsiella pneumoniae subsp. ozaenae TaxID=574 RepID=A0A377ZJG5_KLEPO|nr:iron-sulfur cluster assembly protein SufD [Klebsiella pneumoniae subsp. ozaenae]
MFNGLINVAPLALKTDGQMTNNNLLLGGWRRSTPNRSWKFTPMT